MAGQRYDFSIPVGVDWSLSFPIYDQVPGDLGAELERWSVYVQVTERRWVPSRRFFSWSTRLAPADVSPERGLILLADGEATLVCKPAQTVAWSWDVGWWELLLVSPQNERSVPISGLARVEYEVRSTS